MEDVEEFNSNGTPCFALCALPIHTTGCASGLPSFFFGIHAEGKEGLL
jgi:hypothetical protein